MGRKIEIECIEIPELWRQSKVTELRKQGTRWYVERGHINKFHHWVKDAYRLFKDSGGVLPLQWAADYVGVSRSAVLKRANSGGMTVYSFQVVEFASTIMGGTREKDSRQRFDYAILSECESWKQLLMDWQDELEKE